MFCFGVDFSCFDDEASSSELHATTEAPSSPSDASPSDVGTESIVDRLDKLYTLVFVFFIFFLAFRVHGVFRGMFNNLKRGC